MGQINPHMILYYNYYKEFQMKILMVLSHLQIGGAEKQTINLARRLVEKNMRPALFVFRKHGHMVKEIPEGVDLFFPGFCAFSPFKTLIKIFFLIKVLRKVKPDVLYTRIEHASVAIAGKIVGIPTVIVIVNHPRKRDSTGIRKKKDNLISFLWLRLSVKLATHMVTNSQGLALECERLLKLKSKPTVVYNGLETTLIKKKSIKETQNEWIKMQTVPLVVSVTRLANHKGLETLIDAFAILNKKMKAHLLIVGDGKMKKKLLEKVRVLRLENEISFAGWKLNPYPLMVAADLYVSPSTREGFSNSLLEAQLLGIPTISTNHKFGANEIIEDGKNGLLVPVDDAETMAKTIEQVLKDKDLQKSMSLNAMEKVQSFTVEKMTSDYMLLFKEVTKKNNSTHASLQRN